ncbi:protein Z-dependent protease inhibitor-like isoform X1 [Oncorhynchus mykiss]|uniref:Serpin domain-containing protein n=3 Tax=Oncorhynchus mykiss TaxID=8022 RepID=A0A8C7UAK7_ONCMY|nr:protein Z-dependent protease inhibitor-like isoform X1 [Oncorhynchus mykiss]
MCWSTEQNQKHFTVKIILDLTINTIADCDHITHQITMMMKVGLLFLLTHVWSLIPVYQTQEQSPNITDLTFKNMDFAMTLYRKIAGYHDNNIFFSPLSISTAFATLSMAAQGPTRDQILKGLNLAHLDRDKQPDIIPELFQQLQGNITQDESLKLDQSTTFFVCLKFEVESDYSDQIKKFFNADINSVDFANTKASVAMINDYIMRKTENRVKEMVSDLDPLTQLMLINTIFFRGEWQMPFNPNHTEIQRFYIDNYNIVQVPMMLRMEDKFYTMDDFPLNAKVLKLPYRDGVSMLILLPNKGLDYTTIDDEITAERFLNWIKNLKERKLEVQLPKFKMEQSYAMHNILPDLGISSIFHDTANLTKLSKDPGLKVSEVLHKAVIEVDERGTTAAAATESGIIGYALPSSFIVNRPFLFFIYHEATNSLLFMGRVTDPTKNGV